MEHNQEQFQPFDFRAHEHTAISEYLRRQSFYKDLSSVIARILDECLRKRQIKVHSVQHRAKEPESVGRKAATPSERDPNQPKYANPIIDITDLAGVRVITYFPGTLADIDTLLRDEFEIVERSDKSEELIAGERFGYQSIHYLVRVKPERTRLAEYDSFRNSIVEIQVRTILQHAWAEIEHDIQYKSATTIPSEIRRRFMALAGMLEIADREFQTIQNADQK
jgi:ppGpp synthetase/RelA/SpoT-type nucleotidyltranferase